jgi:iron complex transport system ATP-binding protein
MVSYMSQEDIADLGFSVIEILLMGRYPHLGMFKSESEGDREEALRMLSYVGLSGFENRPFGGLSGGERQLALFAKILVQDAGLVVLDEPSSHLDIRHEDSIFSMAQELAREGRAVIASVHNLNVAAHYCTSLLLLDKGAVAGRGEPGAVLDPEALGRVYGVRTLVSRSATTGSLTVGVVPFRASRGGTRIHIIGGAGSAVNLTRELYRLGFSLTGGIAHSYDSDESLWKSLGIPYHSVGAFSRISDPDIEDAAGLMESAEIVVLCAFPIGMGNSGNLKFAARAKRLVVLLPEKLDVQRSFFTEEAREAFTGLCRSAESATQEALLVMLKQRRPGEKDISQ